MHLGHLLAASVLSLVAGCASAQSVEEPPISPLGASDRLGALNNITAEKTAAAAALVTEGKSYALGMVTGRSTPAYHPRNYNVNIMQFSDGSGTPLGETLSTANDDYVATFMGIGTQIDGLGHFGINHRYYNNVHVSDFVAPDGLKQFSIHDLPPIATRGVLLDMTNMFGVSPVPGGTAFNRAEIDAAAEAAGVTIEAGDVVLFHTGALSAARGDTELSQTLPGLGVEGAEYLASLGVAAIGADTWALEVVPGENPKRFFEVHQILLAKNGVYILENIVTDELAADGATAFLFTLGAARFEGTVQGIINPIAIR